ncbi:hypothetical protein V6N11_081257 [Hibiscus sabdariffa]|uniref:Uncharacterized protein n=1 Tax=Hibiscus sabdariffa TaxID=183260 RepID=A0ABR2QJM4_9ROSI
MEPEDPPVNMPRGSAVDPDEEENKVTPSDSSDAKRPKLALLFRCYVLSPSSRVEPKAFGITLLSSASGSTAEARDISTQGIFGFHNLKFAYQMTSHSSSSSSPPPPPPQAFVYEGVTFFFFLGFMLLNKWVLMSVK